MVEGDPLTISRRRQLVKAAYLNYCVGDAGIRQHVLELTGRTELKAVVVDVKGDRGLIPYPQSRPTGAGGGHPGLGRLSNLTRLRARGIYLIAGVDDGVRRRWPRFASERLPG